MIEPATYNIEAYQGATYTLNMTYKIDDIVVDLTGYTAAMQVKPSASSLTTILSLESGVGITLGGAAGTIAVEVDAVTMGAVAAGNYQYDFDLDSGGQVTRLIRGKFTITAEITT